MVLNAYSILDRKAAAFMSPFFMHQDGLAHRSFGDLVNDKNHQLGVNRHPEDYALYKVGTWDDSSGKLDSDDTPTHIVNALDVYIEE